jgi:signal transduction histidine kinase
MRMAGKPSRPTFLWQAALILLPVAVLAGIGCISLRQDKLLAEHEAQQRAQVFADQLAPALWSQLIASPIDDSSNQVVFQVDESGCLTFPPPCALAPAPLPLVELSPDQARLWALSQTTGSNAVAACQRFADSNPPRRFAAIAQYQLGLLLLQEQNVSDAVKAFDLVARQYPDVVGESGLPLQPLAQFKLIELQPPSRDPGAQRSKVTRSTTERNDVTIPDVSIDVKYFVPVDSFCSNIVYHPTLLTPFLLEQLGTAQTTQAKKWQLAWADHERGREIFAAASNHIRGDVPLLPVGTNTFKSAPTPSLFWFALPTTARVSKQAGIFRIVNDRAVWNPAREGDELFTLSENWLATRDEHDTNHISFICRPQSDLALPIAKLTEHIPDYFGVGVELAGQLLTAPVYWHYDYVAGGKGSGQFSKKEYTDKISTNLLASAAPPGVAGDSLKIYIFLTNRSELFAAQQSRVMWFGLLVIASTVAALAGLIAAWRAFHRQLRFAEMKSNFVSSVSHELRAPIASVRLMAESLERGKVSAGEKQNEYFRFIVQECRRLSSLIENVLDFSRIEQGRKQYEFEPTDLAALTRETVKMMEPYAEEKGVKLEFNSKPETQNSELEVDGRAIQQALVNLIDNAIKHSAKGQIVTIGLDASDRRTGFQPVSNFSGGGNNSETGKMPVLLYVEDHGPGIPPAEHDKIFERFYRLGSELRRETQGVGIGLSIVRHIVAAHGGKVTVRSNPGQGSRFTIVLPHKRSNE